MDDTRDSMTVKEAMRYLSLSDSTIRRMLAENVLKRAGKDGKRVLIERNSIEDVATELGRTQVAASELKREISPTLKGLAELVQGLTETIHSKDERMIVFVQEMVLHAQHMGEALGEAREKARRLPEVEDEVRRLREELDEAKQLIAKLKASKLYQDQNK